MTTYNTGNPLGSTDPKDLYDNAENLDKAVNSTDDTWVDRLGETRLTMAKALQLQSTGEVNVYFAATKSAGDTLAASLADGATVIVDADESYSPADITVRYTVASGALTSPVVEDAAGIQYAQGGVDAYARPLDEKVRERLSVLDFIPVALHAGIAARTDTTNLVPYVQKAVDYAVQNNRELHWPAGRYILDVATATVGGSGPVYLSNLTAAGQGLVMTGEGRDKTIIKAADGASLRSNAAATQGGRFVKLFYFWFGTSGTFVDVGAFLFRDITFDRNGLSEGDIINAPNNSYPPTGGDIGKTLTLSGGTTWAAGEILTLTSSASLARIDDYPGGFTLTIGADSVKVKIIDQNATSTVAQVRAEASVPVALRDVATASWVYHAPYDWEQSHMLQWGTSGATCNRIDPITFERCEFRDKVGDCVGFGSHGPALGWSQVTLSDCKADDHPAIDALYFGQRGDFEFGADIPLCVIDKVTARYSQIEPTTPSSSSHVRHYKLVNSKIDAIEFTDSGGFSFIDVVNCHASDKLLVRGMNATIVGGRYRIREATHAQLMKIANATVLLEYNSVTNAVTRWDFASLSGASPTSKLECTGVHFEIDDPNPLLAPTGYAVGTSSSGDANNALFTRTFTDCWFDPRLEATGLCYGNGKWAFNACTVACRSGSSLRAFTVGSAGVQTDVILNNLDYSQCAAGSTIVHLQRNATTWTLRVTGTYDVAQWKWGSTGSSVTDTCILAFPELTGTAAPGAVFYPKGSTVRNIAPTAGANSHWTKLATSSVSTDWAKTGYVDLSGSKTHDWPDLATATTQSTTVTITGAAVGDFAEASMSVSLNGTRMWAEVTAADTVTVYQRNDTGANVNVASGTLRVRARKA